METSKSVQLVHLDHRIQRKGQSSPANSKFTDYRIVIRHSLDLFNFDCKMSVSVACY